MLIRRIIRRIKAIGLAVVWAFATDAQRKEITVRDNAKERARVKGIYEKFGRKWTSGDERAYGS